MEQAHFRFVHLTDTHIMVGGKWKARGGNFEFDTEASLRHVVEAVRTLDPAPAFAVLGGDLASPDLIDRTRRLTPDEYEPSYELLAEILGGLPCPIHFLVGNHDNRVAFNRVLRRDAPTPDAPNYYSFDHYGYHFVALDSQEPGQNGGFLDAAQLIWLREDLKQHREQPTIAFVHHHPWPLGLQWIDTMTLRNGDELIASLREHPALHWLICGHVHLDQAIQRGGITMLTTLYLSPAVEGVASREDATRSTRLPHRGRGGRPIVHPRRSSARRHRSRDLIRKHVPIFMRDVDEWDT